MFSKKLVVIAASVALALSATTTTTSAAVAAAGAAPHHHNYLKIHFAKGTDGSEEIQIDDIIVDSSSDSGSSSGSGSGTEVEQVPDAASGEAGSEVDAESLCTGQDESPMSVVGVEGAFCVKGTDTCAADNKKGVCPGPQEGLENGSECAKIESGVYGCVPAKGKATASQTSTNGTDAPKHHHVKGVHHSKAALPNVIKKRGHVKHIVHAHAIKTKGVHHHQKKHHKAAGHDTKTTTHNKKPTKKAGHDAKTSTHHKKAGHDAKTSTHHKKAGHDAKTTTHHKKAGHDGKTTTHHKKAGHDGKTTTHHKKAGHDGKNVKH